MSRDKENRGHFIFFHHSDNQGRAIVGVGIGHRVVQIHVEDPIMTRVIPVAADDGARGALYFPLRGTVAVSPLPFRAFTLFTLARFARYAASGFKDRAAP